jgi:hypothetical protein
VTRLPEPVIATALADVLVVAAEGRDPAALCAQLLDRFPGARLVLVVDAGGNVTAGFRQSPAEGDGTRGPVRLEYLQGST